MSTRSNSSWRPRGVKKSNSNASTSAMSIKSHDSVSVLGTHPFGTLHIHKFDESPEDSDASGTNREALSEEKFLVAKEPGSPGGLLTHNMGGGDVVLILDLPDVYTIGYDSISFTAKHFCGLRDVPAGPHLFWVAHPDGVSARCGFWIIGTEQNTVHVMQWDRFNEVIGQAARAEARIQADCIASFHSKLIPYDNPTSKSDDTSDLAASRASAKLKVWEQLTGSISEPVLSRVIGQPERSSYLVHTADRVRGALLMTAEIELEKTILNPLLQTRELKFSFDQHSKTYSALSSGAERTLEARDSTPYLLAMINSPGNDIGEGDILGEFQLAYVTGMHLGNDACIQQWWHMMVKLVLKAYLLPDRRPNFAAELLRTVTTQLTYGTEWLDNSLLDYADANSRELRLALMIYKRRLDELLAVLGSEATPAQLSVGTTFARLESRATALGWDISGDYLRKGKVTMEDGEEIELELAELQAEDERGEWAPEVVELDEHGRQRDLITWND